MSGKAESFIELARNDIAVARLVLKVDPGNAAFHLQQAAEKLAKAVLTIETIAFGTTHQIGALAAMLPADHVFRPDLAGFDAFSSYGTSTRYPLPGGGMPRLPSQDALKEGIRDVASVIDEIDDFRREREASSRPR
ncbi:HEPN domain-containing protein [Tardiphaga sp.]|uniref:HEPN domain-containing protein n=1 Tax=Tardiphaga sp. TaxID=1926292 RepID=UPI00352AB15E|nr:HEPN domain-containing protein [Hyphomicrobiales bacterium]